MVKTSAIPDTDLSQISEFVAARMGLDFPPDRWRDLERGLDSAAGELGFPDGASCARWLLSAPLTRDQVEILAGHLTIGETYFFREKRTFEILGKQVLPALIASRRATDRRLRIWSAGCCTGEEPYSIAILLDQLLPDIPEWHITILATDINPHFLRKATAGLYGQWSFRDGPRWIQEKYFRKTGSGHYEIDPRLKRMVTFSCHNLAEDNYPSLLNNTNAMDVIFCRNVLMYFSPERIPKVVQSLYHSLVEGGWLIVSPAETSRVLSSQFVTVNYPDAIFYRKDSRQSRTLKVPQPANIVDIPYENSCFINRKSAITEPQPELVPRQSTTGKGTGNQETVEAPPTPYQEALALYEQGTYTEAEQKLIQQMAPGLPDPPALSLLARVYANQGKLAEAQEWCEKAIDADKLAAAGHFLRATILQEMGRSEEAIGTLKRVLYLEPDFVLAHVTLGNLALRQGKVKEAEKWFENALSLLAAFQPDEVLAEAEGLTAGRLREIIESTKQGGSK